MKDTEQKMNRKHPATEYYPGTNRPLLRPKIRYGKAVAFVVLVLAVNTAVSLGTIHLLRWLGWEPEIGFGGQFAIFFSFSCLLSFLLFAKRIVIFFIRIYQRYVSYDIRSRCCLIPNCSEYMIMAINKYGLIHGIKKGWARLHRCGTIDGIEDLP